jgi:hypothetical protein
MYIIYKNSPRSLRRTQFASINFGSPVKFTGYIVGLKETTNYTFLLDIQNLSIGNVLA